MYYGILAAVIKHSSLLRVEHIHEDAYNKLFQCMHMTDYIKRQILLLQCSSSLSILEHKVNEE